VRSGANQKGVRQHCKLAGHTRPELRLRQFDGGRGPLLQACSPAFEALVLRAEESFRSASTLPLQIVPPSFSSFHYKFHALKFRDVGKGIAGDRDQISEFTRLDRAHAVLPAQEVCGHSGC
jgi:hypothetical protein